MEFLSSVLVGYFIAAYVVAAVFSLVGAAIFRRSKDANSILASLVFVFVLAPLMMPVIVAWGCLPILFGDAGDE